MQVGLPTLSSRRKKFDLIMAFKNLTVASTQVRFHMFSNRVPADFNKLLRQNVLKNSLSAFKRLAALQSNSGGRALAIGDGANDVPMIQAAHVGIGIVGKEGMQLLCFVVSDRSAIPVACSFQTPIKTVTAVYVIYALERQKRTLYGFGR
ncbi:hypothetical protein COOONC_27538 [Cooperia oncophora]